MNNRNFQSEVDLINAIKDWESSSTAKGEIFTKPEIVNLMLDISGIHALESLVGVRVLEPSCGQGEFLVPLVRHFLSLLQKKKPEFDLKAFANSILAFDIVDSNVQITRGKLAKLLQEFGAPSDHIEFLVSSWVKHGDFLHATLDGHFSHVLGNPPYVRVENIPKLMLDWYRENYKTMGDRSDLYIPFFEKSLNLLAANGKLCFICTDRWIKNQYGRKLRQYISQAFSLDLYVDLYGSDSFQNKVLTYPAITLISKEKYAGTIVCHNPIVNSVLSEALVRSIAKKEDNDELNIKVRKDVVRGDEPWLMGSADQVSLIRHLETSLPTLEAAGCNVFIGTATGNNDVFIVDGSLDIEASRKLPVITASEISGGFIESFGKYIINTYTENAVVDLADYPKLSRYIESFKPALSKRHVAKNAARHWYKTIDRVYPNRATCPKLMIPDIKSELTVVYDEGKYHPNNSIYYICSDSWDLYALKSVLMSGIGKLFVEAYTTKIANGYLRFQAQHLRRIRVPYWSEVPPNIRLALNEAGQRGDKVAAKKLVVELYKLNSQEEEIFSG